jgi:hypothetical protein
MHKQHDYNWVGYTVFHTALCSNQYVVFAVSGVSTFTYGSCIIEANYFSNAIRIAKYLLSGGAADLWSDEIQIHKCC